MKITSNNFRRDKIVKASFIFSFLMLLFGFIYTALIYNNLPPLIPVFNQLPWGMQRISEKIMIFMPLIINTLMLTVNIFYAMFFYDKMPLVIRMISITSLFIGFTVLVFIIRTSLLLL